MVIKEIEGFVTREEMCALMAAVDVAILGFEIGGIESCFEFKSYVQLKKVRYKLKKVMEEIDK